MRSKIKFMFLSLCNDKEKSLQYNPLKNNLKHFKPVQIIDKGLFGLNEKWEERMKFGRKIILSYLNVIVRMRGNEKFKFGLKTVVGSMNFFDSTYAMKTWVKKG